MAEAKRFRKLDKNPMAKFITLNAKKYYQGRRRGWHTFDLNVLLGRNTRNT